MGPHPTRSGIAACFAASTCLLGTGCASVDRPADWPATAPPPPGAFAAAGPFDAMASDGIWGTGDEVVYTVDVDDAGVHHVFSFTLTTVQLPPVDPDGIVIAHPVHGHVMTRSSSDSWQHEPIAYAGEGMAKLHAELRGDDGSSCGGDFEAELYAHWWVDDMAIGMQTGVWPLLMGLLGLDCMHAMLLRVVRPPSAWSVLSKFGRVHIGLQWLPVTELHYVDEATPFGVLPTTWLPITITANDQPALDGRVQFTWRRPPLLLSAGVLQVEAWHPDDAKRRVTVQLASARRGTPPDAPAVGDLGNELTAGMTVAEVLAVKGGVRGDVQARGRLADGRYVELVQFDVPRQLLFGVLHDGKLLYASLGDDLALDFLRRRGFTGDSPPPPGSNRAVGRSRQNP